MLKRLGSLGLITFEKEAARVRISSQEWEMIRKGEKWALFLGEVRHIKTTKILLVNEENDTLLAYAEGSSMVEVAYERAMIEPEHEGYYAYPRNEAIKRIYFEWCKRKDIRPNSNEGWYKSEKFNEYLKKIGWGKNYILFLNEILIKR